MPRRRAALLHRWHLTASLCVAMAAAAGAQAVGGGSARMVWGFCGQEAGARLTGVWNAHLAPGRDVPATQCHLGMFAGGQGALDGSLFDTQEVCAIPLTDVFRNNSQTCDCMAAPQCNRGRACAFDCGCEVVDDVAGTTLTDYFRSNTLLAFNGTLHFDSGAQSFSCSVNLDTASGEHHMWGYALIVAANQTMRTVPCGTDQFESALWTCQIVPQYATAPMSKGDVFVQEVEFIAAAGPRPGALLGAVATALLVAATQDMLRRQSVLSA